MPDQPHLALSMQGLLCCWRILNLVFMTYFKKASGTAPRHMPRRLYHLSRQEKHFYSCWELQHLKSKWLYPRLCEQFVEEMCTAGSLPCALVLTPSFFLNLCSYRALGLRCPSLLCLSWYRAVQKSLLCFVLPYSSAFSCLPWKFPAWVHCWARIPLLCSAHCSQTPLPFGDSAWSVLLYLEAHRSR